jgi:peroxin-13
MYGGSGMYGGMPGMMGMGMGMGGPPVLGPNGEPMEGDPNGWSVNPWQTMVRALHGFMSFFGRITMLVDENTYAIHFFITALLQVFHQAAYIFECRLTSASVQLFDRAGTLYGELARFVLRLLGLRTKKMEEARAGPMPPQIEGPPPGAFDAAWPS